MSYKTHVSASRESYNVVVPTKQSNESQGGPKEAVEGRALTKENTVDLTRFWTQSQKKWVKRATPCTRSSITFLVILPVIRAEHPR